MLYTIICYPLILNYIHAHCRVALLDATIFYGLLFHFHVQWTLILCQFNIFRNILVVRKCQRRQFWMDECIINLHLECAWNHEYSQVILIYKRIIRFGWRCSPLRPTVHSTVAYGHNFCTIADSSAHWLLKLQTPLLIQTFNRYSSDLSLESLVIIWITTSAITNIPHPL